MEYNDALSYLYSKLPLFSQQGPSAIKTGPGNTIELVNALGNPQEKLKTVHVAGTNGKGSCSHALASILQASGYRTGLYTSPHLYDFRERIKVDGWMCEKAFVADFVERMVPIIERLEPSFFEVTVAMAFAYFKAVGVEVAVIEVGLGGRLDSTNIIHPELSVITNIGLEHTQILGDTLAKIAFEKAGIIKTGVPIVIGEYVAETKPVFQAKAASTGSSIFFATDYWEVKTAFENANGLLETQMLNKRNELAEQWVFDLTGLYQAKNLPTILEACEQLKRLGFNLTKETIRKGLSQTKSTTGLRGRWEKVHELPSIYLDVAHNANGAKLLSEQLAKNQQGRLHIVLGMSKDKDVETTFSYFPKHANYYFTQAALPRSMDKAELKILGNSMGLLGDTYSDVNLAVKTAIGNAEEKDWIVVCGSIFVVGELNLDRISIHPID